MKGKIDKAGFLFKNYKKQLCPFTPDKNKIGFIGCGDWCPHFREPSDIGKNYDKEIRFILKICHGTVLEFTDFYDERE